MFNRKMAGGWKKLLVIVIGACLYGAAEGLYFTRTGGASLPPWLMFVALTAIGSAAKQVGRGEKRSC